METTALKKDIIQQLQKDILLMQGHKAIAGNNRFDSGLGPIERSFPNNVFTVCFQENFDIELIRKIS